jgi:hypothetical protein
MADEADSSDADDAEELDSEEDDGSDEEDEDDEGNGFEEDEESDNEDEDNGSEEENDDEDGGASGEEESDDEDNGSEEEDESFEDHGSEEDDVSVDLPSATDILVLGLRKLHFDHQRIDNNNMERRIQWFQAGFGCPPYVVEQMWIDLHTTEFVDARIEPEQVNFPIAIVDFLMTLEWLRCYQTELRREGYWGLSTKTIRKRCWYYAEKLQALKAQKIVWPDDYPADTIWICTVDGTHFMVNEPRHPEFSQDKAYFSHKKNHAGWCYELGICLYKSQLIWMHGPFKAGRNDKNNFVHPGGLKERLAQEQLMAIGDKFYNGYPDEVSIFNRYDEEEVKQFKRSALLRHEKFNGLLKQFDILDHRFRHVGAESFATCFEAVAVVCQYRIELECPLDDI